MTKSRTNLLLFFASTLWMLAPSVLTQPAKVVPRELQSRQFWDKMKLSPKPVLHLAGEKDTLVKYEWQQRTMEIVRRINKCAPDGKPWEGKLAGPGVCIVYESKGGTPCWCFIHPGGHTFPTAAPQLIAEFFQKSF